MSGMWPPAAHAFPVGEADAFLAWAAGLGASDIAFQTGSPAMVEIDGRLRRATAAPLDSVAMARLAGAVFGATAEAQLRSGRTIDCSHAIGHALKEGRRFRCNLAAVHVAGGFGINLSMRVLPDRVPAFDELAVEPAIREAWERTSGLTLVTGVPGSGKSTLLAAGTRHLLENGKGRVQSYEAPIEFVFDRIGAPGALMSSSEVPRHVPSFAEGLRASLRRRPAAVVLGEARDRETVEALVRAADTGIAVYSTAHTVGVAATIRRLVAEFDPQEREERAVALAEVLNLVVTQVLWPRPGGGRQAVREWLVFPEGLRERLISNPPALWPAFIRQALAAAGSSLAAGAARAFERGLIDRAALKRARAMEGRDGIR